jgi:hypothetical protein
MMNYSKIFKYFSAASIKKKPSWKRKNAFTSSFQDSDAEFAPFSHYQNNFGYNYQKFVYDDEADFFRGQRNQF